MLVTICIIAYNAERTVEELLDNLLSQTYPLDKTEIVLVDGMSSDNTKNIFLDFLNDNNSKFYNILVLDNPKRTLPNGWNIALAAYSGDVIVRLDAHTTVSCDFIEKNVKLIKEGHQICGGLVSNEPANQNKMGKSG